MPTIGNGSPIDSSSAARAMACGSAEHGVRRRALVRIATLSRLASAAAPGQAQHAMLGSASQHGRTARVGFAARPHLTPRP
jgi:hypothetical protein